MKMKATVDADLCIGCELCAGSVPDVFSMDGSVAVAIDAEVDAALEGEVEDAIADCPVEAISAE